FSRDWSSDVCSSDLASFGKLYGDAKLTGTGDSIASLLGSSNGEMSMALSRGTISRFLMEAAGLNVANVIFVKLFGDEQVMLECRSEERRVGNVCVWR